MANWDVFHSDRLELERELDPAAIRRAFECGDLRDDDLVRPAGTTVAWSRLADMPELTERAAGSAGPSEHTPASPPRPAGRVKPEPPPLSDYEVESDDFGLEPADSPATLRAPDFVELGAESDVAFPIINDEPQAMAPVSQPSMAGGEEDPPGGWLWAESADDDDEDFSPEEDDAEAADESAAGGLQILDDDPEYTLPLPQDRPERRPAESEQPRGAPRHRFARLGRHSRRNG